MPSRKRQQPGSKPAVLFDIEAAPRTVQPARPKTEKETERDFVDSFMYALTAPLIVYPGWEDSFKDLVGDAKMRRLLHLKEVMDTEACTLYEAMLYLSSVTLVMPIDDDWLAIYMWVFNQEMPKQAKEAELDQDIRPLNVNQKEDLARLRAWIFKRQMEHLRKKAVAENTDEAKAKEPTVVGAEQPRLF